MNLLQPIIRFVTTREAELVEPWEIQTRAGLLRVLPGARTDGASIPRIVDGLEGYHHFEGDTMPAVMAHDQLYAGELCDRKIADLVLYDLLIANGVSRFRAGVYLNAVSVGGERTWKFHTPETIIETRRFASLS